MNLRTVILKELVAAGLYGDALVEAMDRIETYLGTSYRRRGEAGGAARSAKLSPEERSAIARQGAKARWGKK